MSARPAAGDIDPAAQLVRWATNGLLACLLIAVLLWARRRRR